MQLASGTVKKVTLELGGKSANIVLDDADLDLAAAGVLWGTFFHNGQVCESGTRALVSRKIYDEFVGMLVERAGKIVIGDNMDMATDLGPLVAPSQVDTTERYVKLGLDEGAKLLCGGSKPDRPRRPGSTRARTTCPTIFEADNSMKIAQEEIFGPVLCVIPFDSDDEAIKIANDSIYGLGGGVWSKNLDRAHAVAAGMRTGTVWINDYHMITPTQPFGGYKQSGIGRELGDYGYNEYRQIKHVWQNTADRPQRLPPLRRAERQHLSRPSGRWGHRYRPAAARSSNGRSATGRGALVFTIGTGCCESTAPFLYEDFWPGPDSEPVGEVAGVAGVRARVPARAVPGRRRRGRSTSTTSCWPSRCRSRPSTAAGSSCASPRARLAPPSPTACHVRRRGSVPGVVTQEPPRSAAWPSHPVSARRQRSAIRRAPSRRRTPR